MAQEPAGPTPTDRGKNGNKRPLLVEGRDPWSLLVTGANVHDVKQIEMALDATDVNLTNKQRRNKRLYAGAGDRGSSAG
jgi:hypothetical protein